jgi:hypothetical protein
MADRHTKDLVARAKAITIREFAEAEGFWNTLKREGKEFVGPCPQCGGDDRFALNIDNEEDQLWNCRVCEEGNNDAISLAGFVYELDHKDKAEFITICKIMTGETPSPPRKPRLEFRAEPPRVNGSGGEQEEQVEGEEIEVHIEPTFVYLDEAGVPLYETRRFEYRRPDGTPVI